MQFQNATDHQEKFAKDIAQLVWATGPVSYDYHFADRDLFDAIVLGSWHSQGSLFAADATTVAVENGELMGIEIGMPGAQFKSRQKALGPLWKELISSAKVDQAGIAGVLERSEYASWLNPFVH
ncbi:MAG: hypothetical protein JRJ45_09790, partial [Deltaproteobacteria bacterium]|nr:hypothetical protein [Deltaproteobacteria bacterium]